MSSSPLRKPDPGATAACLGALACWSVAPIFIKYLTGYVDLWTQNVLRYLAACLFWMPFLLWSLRTGRLDHSVWKRAIVPAASNIVLQTFWAAAFYYIDPALMNLIVTSSVIWVAGFSIVFFVEERGLVRSKRFCAAMVLSMVGVGGVLMGREDFASQRSTMGMILALAAAFFWGLYTVFVRMAFRTIDSRIGFGAISIYTVAGLAVLAAVFGRVGEAAVMPSWPWACVVISGVTGIALSHVLYYAAMRRIGATIPSLLLLVTPFTVLAISHVVFSESLSRVQFGFGVVLLAGGALAIWCQEHLR
ncbi:MAG TPA: DMT family transporter [Anaerohalosphaeraceae bacterium]|jgi:drug/metabolite transporter (DMT)-like permease|nr:DMT family transporter [Anaerohalosphaeraceae bacterium]HRT48986.1 DMT family transporter [Anaerohalosphaeraceae bacterium]HRT85109.1 DMT family transporter [Anaerohalosphaeraceae bacterium]